MSRRIRRRTRKKSRRPSALPGPSYRRNVRQADEVHLQIIAHYDRTFRRYPRCAVVEMWVADQAFRPG